MGDRFQVDSGEKAYVSYEYFFSGTTIPLFG